MNQTEIKQMISADPYHLNEEVYTQIKNDKDLHQFYQQALLFEKQLKNVLEVEVPKEFEDKLNAIPTQAHLQDLSDKETQALNRKQATQNKPSFFKQGGAKFAIAASIMFVFGLGAGQINWGNLFVSSAKAQALYLFHHIQDENQFIFPQTEQYHQQEINDKLYPYRYELTQALQYPVIYLNHCGFLNHSHALHMTLKKDQQLVTVFITHEKLKDFQYQQNNQLIYTYPIKSDGQQGYVVVTTQENDNKIPFSQLKQMAKEIAQSLTAIPSKTKHKQLS